MKGTMDVKEMVMYLNPNDIIFGWVLFVQAIKSVGMVDFLVGLLVFWRCVRWLMVTHMVWS